jgi:hypothetical protein
MGKGSLRRRNAIAGQFAARPIALLESPAFRVLSRAAHLVLARIEIEHSRHGGNDNGALPVPFDHFVEYGLHRRVIAPAIREVVALGLVEVTRRGCAGNAELRQPSLYRLTYRHAKGEPGDGTHEWRRVKTIGEAEALAEAARADANPRAVAAGKKHNSSGRKCHVSVAKTATENDNFPVAETATTGLV